MTFPEDREVEEIFNLQIERRKKQSEEKEIEKIFLRVLAMCKNLDFEKGLTGFKKKVALSSMIDFCIGEYEFYKENGPKLKQKLNTDDLALKVANKYVSTRTAEVNGSYTSGMKPYDHLISTLSTATMALESVNEPLARHDPNFSLINDIFETTFKKITGFCRMMVLGLYLDAYVSWRTIHESESTIYLLVNNGDKTKFSYVKHISYSNMYYTPSNFDDKVRDDVFENQIKAEMNEHGLKSKDMKKFLEYGWLYDCKEYDMEKHPKFKLNFNDGVDELSGLRDQYNEFYRGTSEIAHSSSIFFYANEKNIKNVALMLTYESSYRIFMLYMQFMEEYFKRHENEKNIILNCIDDVKRIAEFLREQYDKEDESDE